MDVPTELKITAGHRPFLPNGMALWPVFHIQLPTWWLHLTPNMKWLAIHVASSVPTASYLQLATPILVHGSSGYAAELPGQVWARAQEGASRNGRNARLAVETLETEVPTPITGEVIHEGVNNMRHEMLTQHALFLH